ncbi:MAG: aminoacyl-tRNA hydrolase [Desulfobulbus sp.]|uniref:aminoacyl-tRNA hydrolase n=1 Tax=Desulfobulbus sp. TaxID=895 RepID=UPI00285179E2|nr:aminoacyl-tRNA hydrolase [Desulfobulbus sp.]MDR2550823.1 aminoacyl-tRNA hydrolase [Desulfobulbus sp.]
MLAGLGNPGREYQLTRHNIGFLFIDHIAGNHGWQVDSLKMQGFYCQGRAWGGQIFLLKPQTYMNRSGECVRSFLDYFKIPPDHLLVLHDDIDLAAGRIKLVARGGAGGHNGIRSIIQHLGTQDFARMKIGIGRPQTGAEERGQPVDQFVLSRFTGDEQLLFDQRKSLVAEASELFIREGIDICMNRINGR